MKGKGGLIGLTDNQAALQRWMLCGLEIAKCEFEEKGMNSDSMQMENHHEEDLATQKERF